MAYTTITTAAAKPVANYKMATRRESGRLVYISGQVAWDAHGAVAGQGDARAQARQALEHLRGVLEAAGGGFGDVVKMTTYLTSLEHYPAVAEVRNTYFPGELPASTLIVVAGLFHPDLLVEIEAVAVID